MSKNIEKQGKRPGYIVGGIFALLLGAVFVMLYFPQLLTALFGIDAIWDLTETFANVFGANFMEMFATWGTSGLLLLMGAVYFICFFARPSANSTMFRFAALFGVLSLMIPAIFSSVIEMAELTAEQLEAISSIMEYLDYAVLAFFALSLIFWIIGFILRFKQKFHKNRSSTVLVFSATFWMLLALFPALAVILGLVGSEVEFIMQADFVVSSNILGFVGVFFVISAIWLFITFPHRVRVEYSTSGGSSSKRPQIIKGEDKGSSSSDFGQPARQPRAPVADNRYQHSFTGEVPYNPAQQNNTFAQNPVLNGGAPANTQFGQGGQPRPTVQPSMNSQSAFSQKSSNSQNFNQPNTSSNSFANGNASQPQNFSTNQPASVSKFGASTQQQVGSVNQGVNGARPTVNPIGANQNNPYASFNNFTQNSPYNRPQTNTVSNNMPPRPVAPQPPRPMQPQGQGNVPRPVQNGGGQQNFNSQSSGTPRVNPFAQNVNRPANPAQMPRQNANPFAPPPPQPQRPVAPRPPVTPFTTPNNPNNNGTNNGNGGNNPAV